MSTIKVYHNPNFLDYWGNHSDIVPPTRPVATVETPEATPAEQALENAFGQTQHVADATPGPASMSGWWNREGVRLHLRSTSVGDVLADEQGNLFVVENMGFRPYRPRAIRPLHRLAEAYRLLDEALTSGGANQLMAAAHQAQNAVLYLLEAEGYPNGELPILPWDDAQPGDLVGSRDTGLFRVMARKLRPKWRAKRLLAHIPGAQLWIDSPRSWAVLVPVDEEMQP